MKTKKFFLMIGLIILGGVSKVRAQQNIVTTTATTPETPGNQNVMYGVGCGTNTMPDPFPTFPGTGTNNSFFGFQSGIGNTFGQSNTFLGSQTGFNNAQGTENVYIGMQSGFTLQNGTRNTFIGTLSGTAFANGANNTFIGANSGLHFTGGGNNTYIGTDAGGGLPNTTAVLGGNDNTFIGFQAGRICDGGGNVFIGGQSGNLLTNSKDNVCIGSNAGRGTDITPRPSTTQNVFIGTGSAINIIGGNKNTFVGYHTGTNTTGNSDSGLGSGNVFLGNESGEKNKNGRQNVYVGDWSGHDNTGSGNVFIGSQAGANYAAIDNHLAIDYEPSANSLIDGDFSTDMLNFNVINNPNSRVTITSNDVHPANTLGLSGLRFTNLRNDNTTTANPLKKVLSVNGSGDVILVDDQIGVTGNTGITNDCRKKNFLTMDDGLGNLKCSQVYDQWNGSPTPITLNQSSVYVGWTGVMPSNQYTSVNTPYILSGMNTNRGYLKLQVKGNTKSNGLWISSDSNYKREVGDLDRPLDRVLKLNGHHYIWDQANNPEMNFDEGVHTGFIAQEVEDVIPHLVITQDLETEKGKVSRKSVNYIELIPYLVEAIKEQQKQIGDLKAQLVCINEKTGCNSTEMKAAIEAATYENTRIVTVAPNPSKDVITVVINVEKAVDNASLQIFDLNGKQLNSLNVKERGENISKTFQKDNFGTGTYIVSLIVNGKSIDSKKIIFE